jgi:hypothetical protein
LTRSDGKFTDVAVTLARTDAVTEVEHVTEVEQC